MNRDMHIEQLCVTVQPCYDNLMIAITYLKLNYFFPCKASALSLVQSNVMITCKKHVLLKSHCDHSDDKTAIYQHDLLQRAHLSQQMDYHTKPTTSIINQCNFARNN